MGTAITTKRKRNAGAEEVQFMATSRSNRKTQLSDNAWPFPEMPMTQVIDLTGDEPTVSPKRRKQTEKSSRSPGKKSPLEKRARRYRSRPPQSFLDRLLRVRTQRMIVLSHNVSTVDDTLEMTFDVAGTTGNMYQTTIGKVPWCTCPDNEKGNQCKHIIYVLLNVLKASGPLQYQLAFLSSELRELYESSSLSRPAASPDAREGNRKLIEGDCPICFTEMESEGEDIVWCRAQCGQNVHKACFERWAAVQAGKVVRCVYCRSSWEGADTKMDLYTLRKAGHVNEEGYLNVGEQLSLPGVRDYSTYSPFLGRRRYYSGWSRGSY